MVALSSVLVALCGATTIIANPINMENSPENLITRPASTRSGNGTHDGFFYHFWLDGEGSVNYTNEAGGKYSVTWDNVGNFLGGKGWSTGSGRNVTYSGTWNGADGNSYVSLYGFMHDPFVEYYIVESFGTYNPSSGLAKKLDSINVDGGTYDTYKNTRIIYSLDGTSVLQQLYSIRQQKRVGGTINAQAHFDAWAKTGQKLGKHSFQILSTEGYRSSGSASITVQGS